MIHGVSVFLWDALNIQDMKQLMKGMDASERAVAEIYNAKTGIAVETLRSMMTKETWLTGREALEKGFASCGFYLLLVLPPDWSAFYLLPVLRPVEHSFGSGSCPVEKDGAASGAEGVGAAPNNGAGVNQEEQDAADIQAVVNAYNQTKGGMK